MHRLPLSRLLAAVPIVAAIACTLQPYGTSEGPLTSPGDDASLPPADAAADAASPEPDADATAPSDDAAPQPSGDASEDASEDVKVLDPDAAIEAGDPCDLDEDGHRAATERCGGDDCCDYDGRARPGATNFSTTPTACGGFDFDCDGKETAELDVASCKLGFLRCSGDGFAQKTACGVTADFVHCTYAGFSCNASTSARAQPCR